MPSPVSKMLPFLSACTALALFGNPQNSRVIEGSAHFEGMGTPELVIQAADGTVIEWDSFSIGAGETARFYQPSADSAVLNRVTGLEMSELMGSLHAEGKVFLVNPNGIVVGEQGVIDAAAFIASSFDLSNEEFLAKGTFVFQGESAAPLVNRGEIRARQGDLILVARRVENSGRLSAPGGNAALAAGHEILVSVDGKEGLYVRAALPGDGILNEGKIEALRLQLESHGSPYSLGIQNKGSLDALKLEAEGGRIFLRCKGSLCANEGSMSAPGGEAALVLDNAPLENRGSISSLGGSVSITGLSSSISLEEQKSMAHYGSIEAGTVSIAAPKFECSGSISTDSLSAFVPGVWIETAGSRIAANEMKAAAGHYFTSGQIGCGKIDISSDRFCSMAGTFSADSIRLAVSSEVFPVYLNGHVQMRAGRIEIFSPLPVQSAAVFDTAELEIPSSLAASFDPVRFADPNPVGELRLWGAFIQSQFPNWEYGRLDLNEAVKAIQTACPPSSVEFSDPNPTGAMSSFGDVIVPLSTGNIVVVKYLDSFAAPMAGAVYLYNATTGALIAALRGSQMNDQVGSNGAVALTNGNYVVSSPEWNNGGASLAGAATWGSGTTGVSGSVDSSNSLVGAANDQISSRGVYALTNGNYVVASPEWNGTIGAATWGNGATGITGSVTAGNSLTGAVPMDYVAGQTTGQNSVCPLSNGHYVVLSPECDIGGLGNAGAATWCNGTMATSDVVSALNSLVGDVSGDRVGLAGAVALNNGNYVVRSMFSYNPLMNSQAGSATWCNGSGTTTGAISMHPTLYGAQMNDVVSGDGVIALANGNYVVMSSQWANGGNMQAGAVTWGDGSVGTSGTVGTTNSLCGTNTADRVGIFGLTIALANGNFLVCSSSWRNGVFVAAGAATLGDGGSGTFVATGLFGYVSAANSLVGSQNNDAVGSNVPIALTSGDYVVLSTQWDDGGTADVGAITWCDGTAGRIGPVTTMNSLVGTSMGDNVGTYGLALPNGNYVVASPFWNAGAGAVTYLNGSAETVGIVDASNSILGSALDVLGLLGVQLLSSEQFVFYSPGFDDGANSNAGAVSFGSVANGTLCDGSRGPVSAANSFVGGFPTTDMTGGVVDNSTAGGNFSIVQFNSYNGETRVFSIAGIPTPPAAGGGSVGVPAYGIHDFAIAISEAFGRWNYMTMKDYLDSASPYPPMGTYLGLQLWIPSLVQTDEFFPKILYR